MTRRRTLYLPLMIAVAVACAVALSALSQKAEATFPGKNGRIAYASYDAPFPKGDLEIYTIDSRGGISSKLPTTMLTRSGLPTRPAARGSPTRRSREPAGSTR